MMTYKVALNRSYIVTINAENEDCAKRYSEFYLGNCPDMSTPEDRSEKIFEIDEIDLVVNDATEILETSSIDEE